MAKKSNAEWNHEQMKKKNFTYVLVNRVWKSVKWATIFCLSIVIFWTVLTLLVYLWASISEREDVLYIFSRAARLWIIRINSEGIISVGVPFLWLSIKVTILLTCVHSVFQRIKEIVASYMQFLRKK